MAFKFLATPAAWLCLAVFSAQAAMPERRAITVEDAISMTRLADPMYFLGGAYEVAQFSPDGSKFVIVLRKGDLATNTNIYTMYLFSSRSALNSPKGEVVLRMRSSSNLPAIRSPQWLGDNQHIAFLGVEGTAKAQVFVVDAASHRLSQMTHHRTDVAFYSISDNGTALAFASAPFTDERTRSDSGPAHVITAASLSDVLFGSQEQKEHGLDLYVNGKAEKRIPLPAANRLGPQNAISISPDGHAAIVTADYRAVPPLWQAYHDDRIRAVAEQRLSNASTGVHELFLVDTGSGRLSSVVGAPAPFPAQIHWSRDARFVYLKTYLPLEPGSAPETDAVPVQLTVDGGQIRRMTAPEWDQVLPGAAHQPLRITLEEDPNTPPRVFAANLSGTRKVMLLDLNPQFAQLEMGKVEQIDLNVRGINVVAGLYYPPHYVPGNRYPLVIQTHGFDRQRFSMDGSDEWSSGFAARPLAAEGFLVLQMLEYSTEADHERSRAATALGANKLERAKELVRLSYEAAIDTLDQRGLIDRNRVGISGFSRSVMFTTYTLTHSQYAFRAGVLTDGIDAGWYQYLTYGIAESVEDNGGESPFTTAGLSTWIKQSPSFSMERVHTPMRIVALGQSNVMEMWEWYSALRLEDKPVEMVEIPGAVHLLERPKDRLEAMEGIVDWFRFWLQGTEAPDPAKSAQYARWRMLRQQQLRR